MRGRSIDMNQTAHISLQCLQFSNNVDTKLTDRAKLLPSATASFCLYFASTSLRFRPAVSATVAIIAAGEGAFTHTTKNPQPLKYTFFIFFQKKSSHASFFIKLPTDSVSYPQNSGSFLAIQTNLGGIILGIRCRNRRLQNAVEPIHDKTAPYGPIGGSIQRSVSRIQPPTVFHRTRRYRRCLSFATAQCPPRQWIFRP